MAPPSKSSKLKTIHQANEDLDLIIKRHKKLIGRLGELTERERSHKGISGTILDKRMEGKIKDHLNNRRYEEAEEELDDLEGKLDSAQKRSKRSRALMTEFQPLSGRWKKMIAEGAIKDREDLEEKVVSLINKGRLDDAERAMGKMKERLGSFKKDATRKATLKEEYEELCMEVSKLHEEGIVPNRVLHDKSRIEVLLKRGDHDELERVMERERRRLESIRADHDDAKELYQEIDRTITDFSPKGRLKIPSPFKKGLREMEEFDYAGARKSFKKAKDLIGSQIDDYRIKLEVGLDGPSDEYRMRRWEELDLLIKNEGNVHLADIAVLSVSDNFKMDLDEDSISIKAGKERKVPIRLNFLEEGQVPIKISLTYTDPIKNEKMRVVRKFKFDVEPRERVPPRIEGKKEATRRHQSIKKTVHEMTGGREEVEFKTGDFYSYRILNKLGSGGFSTIYRVQSGERIFAMKTPKDIGLDGDETIEINERAIRKFKREANVWATLTDILPEDVVRLEDVGLEPFPWFVMELASGSLRDILMDMEFDERLEVTMDILSKFDRIHHQGIVHRDIKPENILLVEDGLKVTDFGISKLVNSTTRSTMGVSGTCYYMSPEQIQKSRFGIVDWRTDIWQLGVLIYEIFTSRFPFDSDSPYEVTSNIMHEEPQPISKFDPELKPLDEILLKALNKEKKDRWQSALELRLEIGREMDL